MHDIENPDLIHKSHRNHISIRMYSNTIQRLLFSFQLLIPIPIPESSWPNHTSCYNSSKFWCCCPACKRWRWLAVGGWCPSSWSPRSGSRCRWTRIRRKLEQECERESGSKARGAPVRRCRCRCYCTLRKPIKIGWDVENRFKIFLGKKIF